MIVTKVQSRFINSKLVGFTLLKGKKNTGKTVAAIKRAVNLENNYCLYSDDKILYVSEEKKTEIKKVYKEETLKNEYHSLFSSEENKVEFLSLAEIVSMYAKGYYNGRKFKLISEEEAFDILKSESFTEAKKRYSKKSKLIAKMELREIYEEILWIKACGFSLAEYLIAVRKGRKRIIRKSSFSREFIYNLMEIYTAELIDKGYKDCYDDVLYALKYAEKYDGKYTHIIFEDVENCTRAEIELIKKISSKKEYSSLVFSVGDNFANKENVWLIKGRRYKELGGEFKGRTFNFKTVYHEKSIKNYETMNQYKYLNLKNKNIIDFKLDNSSIEKEIFIEEVSLDRRSLKQIPVFNEIAAGNPIEINDERQENFYLPKEWIDKNSESFILKIKGDSMVEKNINDGDYVVIKRQNTAYQNDIVAISLNGAATLKILKYNEGTPMLMPANSLYSPISLAGKNAEILGIAVGIIKKS